MKTFKCLSGRKVWVSTQGENTLEIADKYEPTKKWSVRIEKKLVVGGRINLGKDLNSSIHLACPIKLADMLHVEYADVMFGGLMGKDFEEFVEKFRTKDLDLEIAA